MQLPPVSLKYLENISSVFMSYQSLQLESRELRHHAEREGSERNSAAHNFVQAYTYANDEEIGQTWRHNMSGERTTIEFDLSVPAEDTRIRLNPSVRIA